MTDNGAGSLPAALVAAQAQLPNVEKNETNPHFKSRFTSLDELIDKTRGVLNAHGLAIVQFPTVADTGFPILRTLLIHGPTGEQLTCDTPIYTGADPTMQMFGSGITYARRYAWAAVLGIAAETDDDGNTAAPKQEAAKLISPAQNAKIAAMVKALDDANVLIPADYAGCESWVDVLRHLLNDKFGLRSRKELTVAQASELIDTLDEISIPF